MLDSNKQDKTQQYYKHRSEKKNSDFPKKELKLGNKYKVFRTV